VIPITLPMVTYRYSEDGIERLARKATHLSLVILSIAFLGGLTLLWVNGELRGPLPEIVVVGTLLGTLVGASLFLAWRKSVRINRTIAKSTEVELDQDALTARSSLGTTKLGRNEVTEIRYMKDGILVRGANRRHMVHLKPELEGFQELATRIQDWVPTSVRRTRTSSSIGLSIGLRLTSLVVGSLGLMIIALSATTPAVAIPCCLLEAVILTSCAVFVWRSKTVAPRLKWMMLMVILPVISLIGRAYLLSQSH
jgi:hypothetical protein